MAIFDLYKWSSPSAAPSLVINGSNSLLPHHYSSPSIISELLVNALQVEFTEPVPEFKNTRVLSVTIRVFDPSDGTTNTDPTDEYYFSFVPQGEPDSWVLSSTATWQTPTILDDTVLPGQMQRTYVLKAKVIRQSEALEFPPASTLVTIDEVPPITTAVQPAGVYSPDPLSIFLHVDDFTPSTTYYTTNGDDPTQASTVYTDAGILITELDTPVILKYFSVDSAGNIETPNWGAGENSAQYTLDSIPPIVTIDGVTPSLLIVGTAAEVVWRVNEYCPSARIEIGGGGVLGNGTLIHSATAIPADVAQTVQIPATVLPNGVSTLYLFATDRGNNTSYASFELEFDNQIPVVDIYEVCRKTLAQNDEATIVWKTNVAGNYSIRRGGQNPNEGALLGSGFADANKIQESPILSSQLVPNVANEIRIYLEAPSGNIGFVSTSMSVDTLPPTTTINISGSAGPFLAPFGIRIDAQDQVPAGVTIDFGTIHGGLLASANAESPLSIAGNYQSHVTGLDQVATPVISPAGGIKTSFFYCVIACATPGATIYITLNGEEPTTSSMVYAGAFLVDKTLTVKALAVKTDMADSEIAVIEYTMVVETVATPVITGTAGGTSTVIVDITCTTPGSQIRYTLNGSTPTALSTVYTEALTLFGTAAVTVKAVAIKSGMYNSEIATETFLVPIGLGTPSVVDISTSSARVIWTTTRVADSVVEYGLDPYLDVLVGYSTIVDHTLTLDHGVLLPTLQDNTVYYYRVRSTDSDVIVSEQSTILSFTTNSLADMIPPTITNLSAEIVNSQEIEITWMTDEPSSSIVIYGDDEALSSPIELPAQNIAPRVSLHTYRVTGLTPNTQYWFKAKSLDEAGNQSVSSESVTATTWAADNPIISDVVINPYRTVCVIKWQTDVPTTGHVQYDTSAALGLTAMPMIPGYKTQHEVIIQGLTPDRQYYFTLVGQDEIARALIFTTQTFNSAPNRDARLIIYASTDGTTPTTNQYQHVAIGNPLLYTVEGNTVLKYFALDGFGNQQEIQTEFYAFDVTGPVITVDFMEPLLLNATMAATLKFKSNEDCHYTITNDIGTILATNANDFAMNYSIFAYNEIDDVSDPASLQFIAGLLLAETWTEVQIFASSLVEGYNHITIEATDIYGNTTSVLVGHLIKDTTATIVQPSIAPGYYNHTLYISLIPINLREGEDVAIYYTTDGSLPTLESSVGHGQVYNILVPNTTTIRWFSVDEAGNVSDANYATYVIDKQAPIIYATPLPGIYDEVIDVELKSNEAATIFYTTDETLPVYPPNEHTSIYTKPIQVLHNTVITCFARDLAGNVSEIKTFEYEINILYDKKFKKVIGFQDKMFLETEFNEAQDNINRRIEEMAKEVIGDIGIVHGFDIVPSNFPGSFEFYLLEGKAYISGKFVTIIRRDQSFVPSLLEASGHKTYHVILVPDEPIFRPSRPGQPGWEEGVTDITTYRLEEGYIIKVVEDYPDAALEPYAELYDIIRPANATGIVDCTIIDRRRFFQSLANFQNNINDVVSDLQANLLALGMEVESYKLRNILGLKNAFVDTFESTKDVDLSKSKGYRYINTRFEL